MSNAPAMAYPDGDLVAAGPARQAQDRLGFSSTAKGQAMTKTEAVAAVIQAWKDKGISVDDMQNAAAVAVEAIADPIFDAGFEDGKAEAEESM